MSLKVYPNNGYNSYCDEDFCDSYYENHLNAGSWDTLKDYEPVMITAFRALQELDLNITFTSDGTISSVVYSADEISEILQDLQFAQCEQILHELDTDIYTPQLEFLSLSGLTVKMPKDSKPERFSKKALAILRSYIQTPVITRTR